MAEFGKASKARKIREPIEFRREFQRIKNGQIKHRHICDNCGSTAVQVKHWSEWNIAEQRFIAIEMCYDDEYDMFCPDCECNEGFTKERIE